MQEVKIEKTAVHDFVTNYLFPWLKFLRGAGVSLEYSTETKSICGLVMAGCHQKHSTEGMRWWGTAKKQTINEIKRLRNNASKNLKISFLGKCVHVVPLVSTKRKKIPLTYVTVVAVDYLNDCKRKAVEPCTIALWKFFDLTLSVFLFFKPVRLIRVDPWKSDLRVRYP
jgi:hypothetical protein